MFVQFNNKLVNSDTIDTVSLDDLMQHGWLHVYFKNGQHELVSGCDAVILLQQLSPATLVCPLMRVCSWLACSKLGSKICAKIT